MQRAALVLLVVALACSGGRKDSKSAGPPPAVPPAAAPAPAATPAAGSAAPAETAAVGKTITLPSGVSITHRVIGTGANPRATDRVTVHYAGTFPDGKAFDSGDATFPLNKVIDCWTEAVQLIKVGGKAQLICPPNTAYGPAGRPPIIPPNATLQFEVELQAVQ
jgi:FKBP-type peptidyl-prolyl cis-trans isomerase FkpA